MNEQNNVPITPDMRKKRDVIDAKVRKLFLLRELPPDPKRVSPIDTGEEEIQKPQDLPLWAQVGLGNLGNLRRTPPQIDEPQ